MIRAVLLDALGTLVRLEPPEPRLRAALRARGIERPAEACRAALRIEMRHYREHCVEASSEPALAALRAECAGIVTRELELQLTPGEAVATLLEAFRFTAYPDAHGALNRLRERGLRLAVVSNWDISLPGVLEAVGLAELVDAVVHSAGVGASKPDPRPFAAALALLGVDAAQALHVGDEPRADVDGAHAAGVRALLLARGGSPGPGRITSLGALGRALEEAA